MPTCKQTNDQVSNENPNTSDYYDENNDESDDNADESEQLSILQTSQSRLVTKVKSKLKN